MHNSILIQNVKSSFIDAFKSTPLMVFSPGRINLIGEHTDYNNGFVFPAAIDKGIVTAIDKTETTRCNVIALDANETLSFTLEEIQKIENGGWKNYIIGVISEIQNKGKNLSNFNIVFGGDIPIGAGLSSSAALENSIVFALNELFQLKLTKEEMIFISQKAEHNYVGVKCGIMDQYTSMFGRQNAALLLDCRNLNSTPINIDFEQHDILLINTNVKHNLGDSAYNERRSVCEKAASLLNVTSLRDADKEALKTIKGKINDNDYQKVLYVIEENKRVMDASRAIKENNFNQLGILLYASHDGLKNQYKVSCNELDFLVEATKDYDTILGARMMGGGFGGCTINLIEKENSKDSIINITERYQSKFNVTPSVYTINLSKGTHLLDH